MAVVGVEDSYGSLLLLLGIMLTLSMFIIGIKKWTSGRTTAKRQHTHKN